MTNFLAFLSANRGPLIFAGVVFLIFLIILLVVFFREKRKNSGKAAKTADAGDDEKKPREKKGPVTRTVLDNIPICRYDEAEGCYILKDGSCMDLMMVNSKDLVTSSTDEIEYDCLKFGKLYKTYAGDLKLIALNFPCNTASQQRYMKQKIKTAKNQVFKAWLEKKQRELIALEKNNTSREFYIMFFSRSIEGHQSDIATIQTVLRSGRDGLVSKIPEEKKHQILYKLMNKSSMVQQ